MLAFDVYYSTELKFESLALVNQLITEDILVIRASYTYIDSHIAILVTLNA